MQKCKLQSRSGNVLSRSLFGAVIVMAGMAAGYFAGKPDVLVKMFRVQRPPDKSVLKLIEEIKANKGLYSQDNAEMVEWYLENLGVTYRTDPLEGRQVHLEKLALAVQLVANLEYEYTVKLPTQAGAYGTSCYDRGRSHTILQHGCGQLPIVHEAISRVLWEMARREPRPSPASVFPLLELANYELRPPYPSEQHTWTYLDVLAYLRIYVRYQDAPFIREYVSRMINDYNWSRDLIMLPGERSFLAGICDIADRQTPEAAAAAYMQRAARNHRYLYGLMGDVNQPSKPYFMEAMWEGWPGEFLTGTLTVKDANTPSPVIGLKHIRKVIEVVVNDAKVLNWSLDPNSHMLTVPIPSGQQAVVHVKVDVLPEYWETTVSPLRDYP
jgi:hypothetical protein